MSTVTLADIEAKHAEVADLIAKFKLQPKSLHIVAQYIVLAPGERCAGPILNAAGDIQHYTILLPGEFEGTWEEAKAWAESIGGVLPTRQEQALLYANLKAEFQGAWYWSGEACSESSAWLQIFRGSQHLTRKSNACRARAVRRFNA